MNFFSDFMDKVKAKKAELDDRRAFQNMVDEEAKPIRRAAYMQQMLKESVAEGIAKAKLDAQKRLPKEKPKAEDYGMKKNGNDQWGFLDNIGIVQQDREQKFNQTKYNKKKK